MKFVSTLVLALLLSFSAIAAEQKVAIVNMQNALTQTKEWKSTLATLDKEAAGKKKELDELKKGLEKDRDELEKQKNVLSPQALQTKAQEMQKRFFEMQNKAANYERDLNQRQAEAANNIAEELRTLVAEISKKDGYTIVIDNQAVLYFSDAKDITADLVKAFNKKKR